jgi:succinate dehydrogenase cytochrome b556 subunit
MEEMHTKKVLEPIWWFFQMISGILLLILVAGHLFATHFASKEALEYSNVVARLSSAPIKAIYILFLLIVVYHGINGMRAIFLDLTLSERARQIVNGGALVIGMITFIYGAYLAFSI